MDNAGADMTLRPPTHLERQLFMEWIDELHAMTEGTDMDAPPAPQLAKRANWVGEMMRAIGYVPTDAGLMMELRDCDLQGDVAFADPCTKMAVATALEWALKAMRNGPPK